MLFFCCFCFHKFVSLKLIWFLFWIQAIQAARLWIFFSDFVFQHNVGHCAHVPKACRFTFRLHNWIPSFNIHIIVVIWFDYHSQKCAWWGRCDWSEMLCCTHCLYFARCVENTWGESSLSSLMGLRAHRCHSIWFKWMGIISQFYFEKFSYRFPCLLRLDTKSMLFGSHCKNLTKRKYKKKKIK